MEQYTTGDVVENNWMTRQLVNQLEEQGVLEVDDSDKSQDTNFSPSHNPGADPSSKPSLEPSSKPSLELSSKLSSEPLSKP
eukprot:12724979-Ditylum_brightwellii.AAC.1